MYRFKILFMVLPLGLIGPICAYAANFCVSVNGGFGSGGTSYIAPAFALPAKNNCVAWSGFTKTATSVIAISTGTGCLASDGKVLTLSIFNTDPEFFRRGQGRLGSNPAMSKKESRAARLLAKTSVTSPAQQYSRPAQSCY
jgi:hypothetical protein